MSTPFPFRGSDIIEIPTASRTPANQIQNIIYIKPALGMLTTGLKSAKYQYMLGGRLSNWQDAYNGFPSVWNGIPGPVSDGLGWKHKTAFDIDLTKLVPGSVIGQIAIAIRFEPAQQGDEVDYSFLCRESDASLSPVRAITVGKKGDEDNLSWLTGDDFSLGKGELFATKVPVRRTVAFVCTLARTGTPHVFDFNLGAGMDSVADPDWSLPLILDPEIKNDG